MLDSLFNWRVVAAAMPRNTRELRSRTEDDSLPGLPLKQANPENDMAGGLVLKAVGPGVQTLQDGDGFLIAYAGFQVSSPAHEQSATEHGGAAIITQREDRLEIESSDECFPRICRASTSWFLDRTYVADGVVQCSKNAFRGDGGPVTMSDGTLALAYISGIEWSTRYAVGRWADEEVRRRKLRRKARQAFKQHALSGCTRGRIALSLEVRFYPGQPDRVVQDFRGNDYQDLKFLLSPVELAHKPFTASVPAVWRQESTSVAQAAVCITWDFSEPVNPLIAVTGTGFTAGPQRPGRETHEDADIWGFDQQVQ